MQKEKTDTMMSEKECRIEKEMQSILFAVLILQTVFKNTEVTVIAREADDMFFYGTKYSTTGFMAMCTVIEPALGRDFKYFREVM